MPKHYRFSEIKPMAVRALYRLQQMVGMTPTEFRAVSLFALLLFMGMTGRKLMDRPKPIDPALYEEAEAAFRSRAAAIGLRDTIPRGSIPPESIPPDSIPPGMMRDSAAAARANSLATPQIEDARVGPPVASSSRVIDLNTASARELMTLPRIGPAIAGRILEFRAANGPFRFVDDLLMVRGIGEKTLDRLRPMVRVASAAVRVDTVKVK